jgi:hypothetical protein
MKVNRNNNNNGRERGVEAHGVKSTWIMVRYQRNWGLGLEKQTMRGHHGKRVLKNQEAPTCLLALSEDLEPHTVTHSHGFFYVKQSL